MKTIIPMLMLTVTASVFAQQPIKDQLMGAVVEAVGATDKNGMYVEGEEIAGNIINDSDKKLYTFTVHVPSDKKEKDPQGTVNAMLAKASSALKDRKEQVFIKILMTRTNSMRVSSGETVYYSRPIYITSWCSGNFCSATIYGGQVGSYDRTKLAFFTKAIASAFWQNY